MITKIILYQNYPFVNIFLLYLTKLIFYKILFTKANSDTDGRVRNHKIEEFVHKNAERAYVASSLGMVRYLSALKYCVMVVGNSSSGIIEVPSFKIPTVNIGNRQLGRVKADSVIDCGESTLEIVEAIKRAKTLYEGNGLYNMKNPYEGVCPSESILYEIRKFLSEGNSTIKSFYSIV